MGVQGLFENIQLKRESQVSPNYLFSAFVITPGRPEHGLPTTVFLQRGSVEENRIPWIFTQGNDGRVVWDTEGYNDKTSCVNKRS